MAIRNPTDSFLSRIIQSVSDLVQTLNFYSAAKPINYTAMTTVWNSRFCDLLANPPEHPTFLGPSNTCSYNERTTSDVAFKSITQEKPSLLHKSFNEGCDFDKITVKSENDDISYKAYSEVTSHTRNVIKKPVSGRNQIEENKLKKILLSVQ